MKDGLVAALRQVAKDLTPADVHVNTPNWPKKQRRKLAEVLLKLAGADPGLYVGRLLTPECDQRVRAWAKAQGLPPLDDYLHVTVAYSKVAVEWACDEHTVAVPEGKLLALGKLGPKLATVIYLRSPSLHARWALARKLGATWDHPAYSPHVTLYYGGPLPHELPPFGLEFGPEVCGGINEGDVFAKAADQPRDDHGRFAAALDHWENHAQHLPRGPERLAARHRLLDEYKASPPDHPLRERAYPHLEEHLTASDKPKFGWVKPNQPKGVQGENIRPFKKDQVHGPDGRFVTGLGVQGPQPKGEKRPTVWVDESGQPLGAEAQGHLHEISGKGFNAPNYSQQRYFAPDPSRKATYVGEVVDSKGRSKRFYLDANEEAKYAVKTARVRAFAKGYDTYSRHLDAASATGNHDALALRLITKTGMRPGSDRETGAAAKAFGATNMPTSAVRVEGDTLHFSFPAKNGKTYVTSTTDKVLADHARARVAAGESRLFDTNETRVRATFKALTGNGKLQLKDIRTAHGTAIAQQELMRHAFKPATQAEFHRLQKDIATTVSKALQNTPKVALEKYILDGVWKGYRPGLRIKVA